MTPCCGRYPFVQGIPRFLTVLLLLTGLLASPVFARTWYIKADGTGDAPTIQAGVNLASAGDVVLVAAGTYADVSTVDIDGVPTTVCVVIDKDIHLVSESGPLSTAISAPTAQVAIYLHDVGMGAVVEGFHIETVFFPYACVTALQTLMQPNFQIGIKCQNFSGSLVGNHVTNNGIGVELTASPAVITANDVAYSFFGVACFDGSNAQVKGNVMYNCAQMVRSAASAPSILGNEMYEGCTAIESKDRSSAIVIGNNIHNVSPVAIGCGGGSSITIEGNQFTDTNLTIFLAGTRGATLVRNNVFHHQVSGAISMSDNPNGTIVIESNTIDLTTVGEAIFCQAASSPVIRRNIITRSVGGVTCVTSSTPAVECNNIFDVGFRYGGECPDQTGSNGNISSDPQFCGVPDSGNYALQSDSPCAPGNHPDGYQCEGIGAFGVGCGSVSTERATWGAIKAMYRK